MAPKTHLSAARRNWLPKPTPKVAVEPTRANPTWRRGSAPAAPQPKFLDQACQGLQVWVTDAASAEPYRLGLELLTALARHPDFAWRSDGALTWLLGTDRVGRDLQAGKSVTEILAADAADHAAWRRDRAPVLMY